MQTTKTPLSTSSIIIVCQFSSTLFFVNNTENCQLKNKITFISENHAENANALRVALEQRQFGDKKKQKKGITPPEHQSAYQT